MSKKLSIGQAAKFLGVSIQTLRRWDKSGKLLSSRKNKTEKRYYYQTAIETYMSKNAKRLYQIALAWASSEKTPVLAEMYFCRDRETFKNRQHHLAAELHMTPNLIAIIGAVVGEIGNNSFDHNMGNWKDVPGIFFAHDITQKEIILADRGVGVLQTLQRVKPSLTTHTQALKSAFTEILSGRAPETRGNGLKFVRQAVAKNHLQLTFQSGNAVLSLYPAKYAVEIQTSDTSIPGIIALIQYHYEN